MAACFQVLLFVCLGLMGACKTPKIEDKLLENINDSIVSSFDSTVNYYSDKAIVRVVLKAPKHLRYMSGTDEYPKGVQIELYNEKGQLTTTLDADYGISIDSKDEKRKSVYGNVVVKNILESQTVTTDTLHWNQLTKKIYTDAYVEITTPNEKVRGRKFIADQEFITYELHQPTAEVKVLDKDL